MKKVATFYPSLLQMILVLFAINILFASCKDKEDIVAESKSTSKFDAEIPTKWTNLQLLLIKTTPGYTPPVAARSLAYTSLGLYESVVHGMDGYQSMAGQINGLTSMPKPTNREYNWGLVANSAYSTIMHELFNTTSAQNKETIDSLRRNIYTVIDRAINNKEISDRSKSFGEEIGNAIIAYSKTDGGHESWNNNFPTNYIVPIGAGFWEPIGSQKIPLLPYWGKNRTFSTLNATTNPVAPVAFSFKENSEMFRLAKEVYDVNLSLNDEKKAIAKFWADGANTITPPGHYFSIANSIVVHQEATLDKIAEVYVKLGMALNDAFIACWRCKYKFNLMRPQTYIQQAINPTWKPLISTPPFPEYSSGHSSGSGATAEILTDSFGGNIAFTDSTYVGVFPNRTFKNFNSFANEAALSRLYGGIHYREANENGLKNGKEIAKNILKFKFKK